MAFFINWASHIAVKKWHLRLSKTLRMSKNIKIEKNMDKSKFKKFDIKEWIDM